MDSAIIFQLLYAGSFVVFLALISLFVVLGVILNYHWSHYEIKIEKIKGIRLLYFTVSLSLLYGMAIAFIFIVI